MSEPTKPSSKTIWTKAVSANRLEPSTTKKDNGWDIDEKPAREWMNWLFYNGNQWTEYFESKLDIIAGANADTTLTLSANVSGAITPTQGNHKVDTASSAATGDLATISQTNHNDGRILILRGTSSARVVTVKHQAGGTGQVYLADQKDFKLDSPQKILMLMRVGTEWYQVSASKEENGRIPLGGVVPLFTTLTGAYAPPATGTVDNAGMMLCNGSAIPAGNKVSGTTPNLSDSRFIMGSTASGSTGGTNSDVHTHSVTSNVSATIPAHNHSKGTLVTSASAVSGTVGGSDGTHPHTITEPNGGIGHSHQADYFVQGGPGGGATTGATTGYPVVVGSSNWTLANQSSAGGFNIASSITGITVNAATSGHGHAFSLTAAAQALTGTIGNTGGSNGDAVFAASVTNNAVTSGVSSVADNRPLYISAVYVMRVN